MNSLLNGIVQNLKYKDYYLNRLPKSVTNARRHSNYNYMIYPIGTFVFCTACKFVVQFLFLISKKSYRPLSSTILLFSFGQYNTPVHILHTCTRL